MAERIDTTPVYPKPGLERLDAAIATLVKALNCIAPGTAALDTLIVRDLIGKGFTTAEAMWAVHTLVERGAIEACDLEKRPQGIYLSCEVNHPAGLNPVIGRVHLDPPGYETRWGMLVFIPRHDELARIAVAVDDAGKTPEPSGDDADLAAKPNKPKGLLPCHERAWNEYTFAVEQNASISTDDDAYNWLNECHSIDALPTRANWRRYLRHARRHHGQQKNTPRIGNPTRSIVRADAIEFPHGDKADQ